jgi:hypothetical protein
MTVIHTIKANPKLIVACLSTLELWNLMTPAERRAVTRGEIWDTPAGKAFLKAIEKE